MPNSIKLLNFLRACTCGPPCRTYVSMVLGHLGDVTTPAPPADARLVRLNAAKIALYESIFLQEWHAYGEENIYDDMAETVRIANMCGASLSDVIEKQRSLSDGKDWQDSDYCEDKFLDTGLSASALGLLCEANVAGAKLPADVMAFMARHAMVHDAECALNIDDDQCFSYSDSLDLSVDEICELAALLRKWDIRSAFG